MLLFLQMPPGLPKSEVRRHRAKGCSFHLTKHHRGRILILLQSFPHSFYPNRNGGDLPVWYSSPTNRPSSEKTFHATDFTCQSVSSTQLQQLRCQFAVVTLQRNGLRSMLIKLRCSDGNQYSTESCVVGTHLHCTFS